MQFCSVHGRFVSTTERTELHVLLIIKAESPTIEFITYNPINVSSLKDKTAKGLLWGGIHNGFQQLLNLCFGIILGRILSPSEYGMIGMLSIFSLIASNLQESGFTSALANRKERRPEDFTAVFWFNLVISISTYTLLYFLAPYIAAFYETPALTPLARYAFLSFVIASFGTAHSAWLFCNLKVKEKAIIQLTSLTISGITGITMAFCGMSYWGLATQSIVYVGCNSILYWFFSGWRPTLHVTLQPLKEMIGFSSKILLTNIITHINNNILSVILGKFYSEREVGLFNQANKWTSMGYTTIQGMITSIAQPVLHNVADDIERQRYIFRKMLRFTAFVSFPCLFGLSLIATEFITVTITEKWIESAHLLQILCVGGAFLPIQSLYTNLLISKGRSGIYLCNTLLLGCAQIASALICYPYGFKVLVISYVCIMILWTGFWHFHAHREIRLSLWDALKDILPFLLIAAGCMVAAGWVASFTHNIFVSLLVKILVASLLYIACMVVSGSETFKEAIQYLLKKKG